MKHRDRPAWLVVVALVSALSLLPLLTSCGTPAEAAPLEVTYYYMPG